MNPREFACSKFCIMLEIVFFLVNEQNFVIFRFILTKLCSKVYILLFNSCVEFSDVNKATGHKANARDLKTKAKDFQHSPRPGQGQGQTPPRPGQGQCHTATVQDQIKTNDVTY